MHGAAGGGRGGNAPVVGANLSQHTHSWPKTLCKRKSTLKKTVMSHLTSYMLSSSNSTPNTQPLNKQGDSISEVELNSLKQFSKKKKKGGSKLKAFRDYSEEFIYCVFSIKDIWKSESYTQHSWPVLKFKNRWGGGRENEIVLSRQKDASHSFSP